MVTKRSAQIEPTSNKSSKEILKESIIREHLSNDPELAAKVKLLRELQANARADEAEQLLAKNRDKSTK